MDENILGTKSVQDIDKIKDPFKGEEKDLFGYEKVADQLTHLIKLVKGNFTVGIDAKWGEGKTYFARHWCAKLKKEKIDAVYIDAYSNDYISDPFLMLAGEIIKHGNLDIEEETTNNAAKAFVGNVIGLSWNVLLEKFLGSENLTTLKSLISGVAEAAKSNETELLKRYQLATDSLKTFKKRLKESVEDRETPLVVIIDELDRCKPDFAVATLERLKHLFEVENIVFILMASWSPLEQVVQSSYGYMDPSLAKDYLRKFVGLKIGLSKYDNDMRMLNKEEDRYMEFIRERLAHVKIDGFEYCYSLLSACAFKLNLSLRDVENCCTLCSVYSLQMSKNTSKASLAWVVLMSVLKVFKEEIFYEILSEDRRKVLNGANSAMNLFSGLSFKNNFYERLPVMCLKLMADIELSADENDYRNRISGSDDIEKDYLFGLMRNIDVGFFIPSVE